MVPICAFGYFSLSDDALEAGIEAGMSRHTEERRGSQTRVQLEAGVDVGISVGGGYMTVELCRRALKWRKGRYFVVPQKHQQQILRVNVNVWVTIFGFLVGPSHEIDLDERKRTRETSSNRKHLGQRRKTDTLNVNRGLQEVEKRLQQQYGCAIFGRLNVNLDVLNVAKVLPYIH